MKPVRGLCLALLTATAASSAPAQQVGADPFRSVSLRSGGEVVVRYGDVQRIVVGEGASRPRIAVAADGRLVIDNSGRPHRSRAAVEVVTPVLDAVSVEDGGRLRVERGFPRQESIAARVSSGGMIDLRSLEVDRATAEVSQGGSIALRPSARLDASVEQGGAVTYWGSPRVTSSIRHGGVVERGSPEDETRPLGEPRLRPLAPVHPIR